MWRESIVLHRIHYDDALFLHRDARFLVENSPIDILESRVKQLQWNIISSCFRERGLTSTFSKSPLIVAAFFLR